MSLSKPKEEFVVIVNFDVSGSMEQTFNETAKREHALIPYFLC